MQAPRHSKDLRGVVNQILAGVSGKRLHSAGGGARARF
jgi:hypothetical protein